MSGVLQSMAVWRAVTQRFSPRFIVIIFGMSGVGRSEILSGTAHVTAQEQLEVVHALVQHVAPHGELTLAGTIWGTAIAASYAAQNPAAVQQLILSSFGMQPNAEMERIVERAQKLIPDCECLLVDGAGHFLHFERPEILDDYEVFLVSRTPAAINYSARHSVELEKTLG